MARVPRHLALPPSGVFHATARGAGAIAIFLDDRDNRRYLNLFAETVEAFEWEVHAFCLMTNHVHLLIECTRDHLSDGFHHLHGEYAQGFNLRHGRWGHLFGERFWAAAIESDEHFSRTVVYILENPVRAGLCARPEEWPWARSRYRLDP